MRTFAIGLSALRSSQFALEAVSNNIVNANTEGYHRQLVHMTSTPAGMVGGFRVGTGVRVGQVAQVRDSVTESSLTQVISDLSAVEQSLVVQRQIETSLTAGGISLTTELNQFYGEVTKLSASPDEDSQRLAVVESGRRLATMFRQSSRRLDTLRTSTEFQIAQEVDDLNSKMRQIADLSGEIQKLEAQGLYAHQEHDERDVLINEVAEIITVRRTESSSDTLNLVIGNVSVQQSTEPHQFDVIKTGNGQLELRLEGQALGVDSSGGRLASLLTEHNQTIAGYQSQLNELAVGVMQTIDAVHSTGVGPAGSFEKLLGTRGVDDSTVPLAEAGSEFQLQAGELTISIYEPDGTQRSEVVTIDPLTESLDDIAAKISSVGGITASVSSTSNTLSVFGVNGNVFDFSGSVPVAPDMASFSGTSEPTFSGLYTGDSNESLSFVIEGSGEIGVSDDLQLAVFDSAGNVRNRFNIGLGYEAGTELDLGTGVNVSLSRGTVSDGDQFSARMTGNPDETGLLAAFGLNSFFTGSDASSIAVDDGLLGNVDRLASGRSSDSADTSNLFRLADTQAQTDTLDGITLSDFSVEITTSIGLKIRSNTTLSDTLHALDTKIRQDRDSVSGVDLNEELVYLQQHQRSYEAAVRVIQTADQVLTDLLNIIR